MAEAITKKEIEDDPIGYARRESQSFMQKMDSFHSIEDKADAIEPVEEEYDEEEDENNNNGFRE